MDSKDPIRRPFYNWPNTLTKRRKWQERYLTRFDQLKSNKIFIKSVLNTRKKLSENTLPEFCEQAIVDLLKEYDLPSPLIDFVAIKFPGLNPVILLINDNLGIISKLKMSFFVKCIIKLF